MSHRRNPLNRIHEVSITTMRTASRTRPFGGALRRNISAGAEEAGDTAAIPIAAPMNGRPRS